MHRPIFGLSLLAYSVVNRMILAALVGSQAVQERHLPRTILLYPVRDFLGFCCWAASYLGSTILWRGRRYRLSRGGLMHSVGAQSTDDREHALTT
jgi:ceramide glucosyltransferase